MANEIAVVQQPVAFADMERMATAIAKSGLFGLRTPEQALALMAISQAEGRHPALAARDYDIVNGRPSKKAEAMARDFLSAGGAIKWHKLDDTVADATFSHPQGGEVRISWDMKRAAQAGLGGKDMWQKYPRQMLRSRCVSEGVRTIWPMATSGLYEPGEVADFSGPTIDATPEPTPPVKPKPPKTASADGKATVARERINAEVPLATPGPWARQKMVVIETHQHLSEGWINEAASAFLDARSKPDLEELADELRERLRSGTTPEANQRIGAAVQAARKRLALQLAPDSPAAAAVVPEEDAPAIAGEEHVMAG